MFTRKVMIAYTCRNLVGNPERRRKGNIKMDVIAIRWEMWIGTICPRIETSSRLFEDANKRSGLLNAGNFLCDNIAA
jgi:hypothetical protein